MDAPSMPSTERQGRRTACVALSATAGAVVLGIIVSLAVGPGGGVEGQGVSAVDAAGAGGPLALAMGGPSSLSSSPLDGNNTVVGSSSSSSSARWFDCPPGVAMADSDAGADETVSFLVLGDWGRQGNPNQRRASDAMADVSACLAPSFVLSVGDNFYPEGLFSADDDQFFRSFADVYGAEGGGDPAGRARLARLPWYAALGNHDVTEGRQGGPEGPRDRFQLTPSLLASEKNGMAAAGRWHCYNGTWSVPDRPGGRRGSGARAAADGGPGAAAMGADAGGASAPVEFAPSGGGTAPAASAAAAAASAAAADARPPLLDIIVIDTTVFAGGPAGTWRDGEREALMAEARASLERRLRASRAAWRLVAGHHPVRSLGVHCGGEDPSSGDCASMAWLAPLLREHGVAAYFAGHEHDLQLIYETTPGTSEQEGGSEGEGGGGGKGQEARWPAYVVSGAGSDIRENEFATQPNGDEAPAKLPAAGHSAPFVADQQGFVAAVANATHLALHYYTLNHRMPPHTTVLARRQ